MRLGLRHRGGRGAGAGTDLDDQRRVALEPRGGVDQIVADVAADLRPHAVPGVLLRGGERAAAGAETRHPRVQTRALRCAGRVVGVDCVVRGGDVEGLEVVVRGVGSVLIGVVHPTIVTYRRDHGPTRSADTMDSLIDFCLALPPASAFLLVVAPPRPHSVSSRTLAVEIAALPQSGPGSASGSGGTSGEECAVGDGYGADEFEAFTRSVGDVVACPLACSTS